MPICEEDPVEEILTEEERSIIEQSYILSKRLNELRANLRRTARETYEMHAIEKQLPVIESAVSDLYNKKK